MWVLGSSVPARPRRAGEHRTPRHCAACTCTIAHAARRCGAPRCPRMRAPPARGAGALALQAYRPKVADTPRSTRSSGLTTTTGQGGRYLATSRAALPSSVSTTLGGRGRAGGREGAGVSGAAWERRRQQPTWHSRRSSPRAAGPPRSPHPPHPPPSAPLAPPPSPPPPPAPRGSPPPARSCRRCWRRCRTRWPPWTRPTAAPRRGTRTRAPRCCNCGRPAANGGTGRSRRRGRRTQAAHMQPRRWAAQRIHQACRAPARPARSGRPIPPRRRAQPRAKASAPPPPSSRLPPSHRMEWNCS